MPYSPPREAPTIRQIHESTVRTLLTGGIPKSTQSEAGRDRVGAIGLDPGGGDTQDYVEDCPVCCRPWRVSVRYDDEGAASVRIEPS
jgi:hypothetical protein